MSELTSKYTRERVKVTVCFNAALLHELEQVEDNLQDAQRGRETMLATSEVTELRKRAEQLRERIREESKTLVFESIGRRAWNNLMSEHPPSEAQQAEAKEAGGMVHFNGETFPPAAMLATCVEPPGFDEEDARVICEELPDGRFLKVWDAVLTANVRGGSDPFDPVSVAQNGSGPKSKRRSSSASRAPSS